MKKYIKKMYKRFINLVHKKTIGYSYYDLLNLDCTIADFILPRLKAYKEKSIGNPCHMSYEEWNLALDKMIYSFDSCSSKNAFEDNLNIDEHREHKKKVREGLILFAENFESLWI